MKEDNLTVNTAVQLRKVHLQYVWMLILTMLVYSDGLPVHFIEISIGLKTTGASPLVVSPTIELALEEMSLRYPVLFGNYSLTRKSKLDVSGCSILGREQVIEFLVSLYAEGKLRQDTQTILLAPLGCSMTFYPVADIARETGFLVATCASASLESVERSRFPTVLSLSYSDMSAYGSAVLGLLRYLGWKTIAVIKDEPTGNELGDNFKSKEMCRVTLEVLHNVVPEINFLEINMDSATQHWNTSLQAASDHSRIILCCTLTGPLRNLLAAATDLNMTAGDYVFLTLYILQIPYQAPLVLEWKMNDTLDQKVKEALPSMLFIRSPPVDWAKMKALTSKVNLKRSLVSAKAVPVEQDFNEHIVICTEMIEIIALVMNESLSRPSNTSLGGKDLAMKFYKRTFFPSLTNTTVSLTDRGTRKIIPEIQQFQTASEEFQTVLFFDTVTSVLVKSSISITWKSGNIPPDRPMCMNDNLCHAKDVITQPLILGLTSSLLAIIAIIVLTFSIASRERQQHLPKWWQLNIQYLNLEELQRPPLTTPSPSLLNGKISVCH